MLYPIWNASVLVEQCGVVMRGIYREPYLEVFKGIAFDAQQGIKIEGVAYDIIEVVQMHGYQKLRVQRSNVCAN